MFKNQKGFTAVEIVILVLVVLLLGLVGWTTYKATYGNDAVSRMTDSEQAQLAQDKDNQHQETEQAATLEGWTKYRNAEHNIGFYYPEDWLIDELHANVNDSNVTSRHPQLVRFSSPENLENLFEVRKDDSMFSASVFKLRVSIIDSPSIDAYLQRIEAQDSEISRFEIDGHEAVDYIVPGYGVSYGILVDRGGDIYEFDFVEVSSKEMLTDTHEQLIRSIEL